MSHISEVVSKGLCTGCGTCVGMCPNAALTMIHDVRMGTMVPKAEPAKCQDCSTCFQVCPGKGMVFGSVAADKQVSSEESLPIGRIIGCWRGASNDDAVRNLSSSGGMLSSLLIHALETRTVDGIMVARMSNDNPLRVEPFIARSRQEVIAAMGSKYVPVAMNTLLSTVRESSERVISVGLPCHIHGMRLAMRAHRRVRENVVMCAGLVCNHSPSHLAMDFILRNLGLSEHRVRRVDFRAGDWPGALRFIIEDGTSIDVPYPSKWYWGGLLQHFFVPERCLLCVDKMCVLSDLTFMDAWRTLPDDSGLGTELVVARTPLGQEILRPALDSGAIAAHLVDESQVAASQDASAHFRRRQALVELAKRRGRPVPSYDFERGVLKTREHMCAFLDACMNAVSYRRFSWPLLSLYATVTESGRGILSPGSRPRG